MELSYATHPNLTRAHQLIVDAIHHNNPHAAMGAMIGVQQVYLRVERELAEVSDPWTLFESLVWDLVRAGILSATEYGAAAPCETRTLTDPEGRLNWRGEVRQYHTLSLR